MTPDIAMTARPQAQTAEASRPLAPPGPTTSGRTRGGADEELASLVVDSPCASATPQPIAVGVPFPKGRLLGPNSLALRDPAGEASEAQATVLARWSDGSVKWVLLDSVLDSVGRGRAGWTIDDREAADSSRERPSLVRERPDSIEIDAGAATFRIGRHSPAGLTRATVGGVDLLDEEGLRILLTDAGGGRGRALVERVDVEARGPIRATVRLEGRFEGRAPCRYVARLCFFAGTGLVRVRFTLHNPNRARHPGGLWDLGDPGSILFRDLTLELGLSRAPTRLDWTRGPGATPEGGAPEAGFEIYQDSSGGENWRSRNHVNRDDRVPVSFRGYRLRHGGREETGLRASPTLSVRGRDGDVHAAIPEFWQQFPKAIEADGRHLRLRLFPGQFGDLFELQGGERKSQAAWFHFGPPGGRPGGGPLDWVHRPARVHARPGWYAASGAVPRLEPSSLEPSDRLEALLAGVVDEGRGFAARREGIDEYGWRHFGEVYADHEQEYYDGPMPAVSHYNNQYDLVLGLLLQYLRGGDPRWFDLADPLARHVVDIDIYHTDRDRAAYNGGLFWFTDHYKDARTCTHRTYSRRNARPGDRSYGGGPSSNHNFTTGLLLHHYLTGSPESRDAAIGLADWVLRMDDGRRNVLGLIDDGPTGLASMTGTPDYHGPGRGSGNSINALLDAWLLAGDRRHLDGAEGLIRRSIHPDDDIAVRDLLDVEKRWSYTVFLAALARYLDVKAEAGELDVHAAYARVALLAYARWMLEHEAPYFDRPEALEFPTEAWAGQEFRKANVLRLAAEHADEPLRSDLARRGDELAERAWADLLRFESRTSARGAALLMVEGSLDASFRSRPPRPAPRPPVGHDFGAPGTFIPQKARVLARLKGARGMAGALARLVDLRRWREFLGTAP